MTFTFFSVIICWLNTLLYPTLWWERKRRINAGFIGSCYCFERCLIFRLHNVSLLSTEYRTCRTPWCRERAKIGCACCLIPFNIHWIKYCLNQRYRTWEHSQLHNFFLVFFIAYIISSTDNETLYEIYCPRKHLRVWVLFLNYVGIGVRIIGNLRGRSCQINTAFYMWGFPVSNR